MEIVVGGAKQDEEPVGHAAASPHCRKEIANPPQKMKKNEKQDFYGCQHFEMSFVMQHTYFASHLLSLFDIYLWHFEMF